MTEFYAPDGGYVDLPGGDDPGSTVPLDAPRGRVLTFTTDEWDRRAAVAECAAELVGGAQRGMQQVARANQFGNCAEGRTLSVAIARLVVMWREELAKKESELRALGRLCSDSGILLSGEDDEVSKEFRV